MLASRRAGRTCKAHGAGTLRRFVLFLAPVFPWVVALEEVGEISRTLAWLFFSKSTLKFSLSPLSLTLQGALM